MPSRLRAELPASRSASRFDGNLSTIVTVRYAYSSTMPNAEFSRRADEILRTLGSRPYRENLAAIDELEKDALVDSDPQAVAVSCADLRLDAALVTHQPYDECEKLYGHLLASGADAMTQLQKSIIFAKESVRSRRVVEVHVLKALQRAREEPVPKSLIDHAERLLAAAKRDEL